ncbi:DUF2249 domain-containing protein [Proteiniclasticum sp. C24MP]|uniref:DUF2249 domain-containing protein n=1 Tax=Proteiniclasticum sp. C24MP TaxID=3374101 RepID=UPI0037541E61
MKQEWEDRISTFKVLDVRELEGNILPMILHQAESVEVGQGITIIQSFEPKPLYASMEKLGFTNHLEKVSPSEYKASFFRVKLGEKIYPDGSDMPLKPTALLNYKAVSEEMAETAVNFWQMIWDKEESALSQRMKLLLSMSNAVGAGRLRQATRELIKSYALGTSVAELDEIFELFAWNQGIGHFSSEIGPSPLFNAYRLIKEKEKEGLSREEVVKAVMEKFGEANPSVSTLSRLPRKDP